MIGPEKDKSDKTGLVTSSDGVLVDFFLAPYGRATYRFEFSIPSKDVEALLKQETSSKLSLFSNKKFKGTIEAGTFTLTRCKRYRNSWEPVIKGKLSDFGGGSMAEISFELHVYTKIITMIWMGMAVFYCAMTWAGVLAGKVSDPTNILMASLMPVFGACLVLIGARLGKRDCNTALEFFQKLPGATMRRSLIE